MPVITPFSLSGHSYNRVLSVYILQQVTNPVLFGNEEVMVEEKQEIVVMVIIVVRVWLTL